MKHFHHRTAEHFASLLKFSYTPLHTHSQLQTFHFIDESSLVYALSVPCYFLLPTGLQQERKES